MSRNDNYSLHEVLSEALSSFATTTNPSAPQSFLGQLSSVFDYLAKACTSASEQTESHQTYKSDSTGTSSAMISLKRSHPNDNRSDGKHSFKTTKRPETKRVPVHEEPVNDYRRSEATPVSGQYESPQHPHLTSDAQQSDPGRTSYRRSSEDSGASGPDDSLYYDSSDDDVSNHQADERTAAALRSKTASKGSTHPITTEGITEPASASYRDNTNGGASTNGEVQVGPPARSKSVSFAGISGDEPSFQQEDVTSHERSFGIPPLDHAEQHYVDTKSLENPATSQQTSLASLWTSLDSLWKQVESIRLSLSDLQGSVSHLSGGVTSLEHNFDQNHVSFDLKINKLRKNVDDMGKRIPQKKTRKKTSHWWKLGRRKRDHGSPEGSTEDDPVHMDTDLDSYSLNELRDEVAGPEGSNTIADDQVPRGGTTNDAAPYTAAPSDPRDRPVSPHAPTRLRKVNQHELAHAEENAQLANGLYR